LVFYLLIYNSVKYHITYNR